jgi:hypothetical protein
MTDRQQAFVEDYLVTFNPAEAARRAAYAPRIANREGSRLLSKADIWQAIQAGKAAQLKAADCRRPGRSKSCGASHSPTWPGASTRTASCSRSPTCRRRRALPSLR